MANPAEKDVTTTKVTPEVAVPVEPVQPVVITTTVAPSVQGEVVTSEPKKKGGAGKTILIGCCVIIACCLISILGLTALVWFGGASILSSNKTADPTLTRISTTADAEAAATDLSNKEVAPADPNTGMVTMTLSEKDILAMAIDALGIQNTPDKVGVKITPTSLKLEIGLDALVNAENISNNVGPSSTSGMTDTPTISGLEKIFASITLGVAADGKTITVQDLSVGNGFIDSILGSSFKQGFEKSLQDNFVSGLEGNDLKLEKIVLADGQVSLTFTEVAPVSPSVIP